MCIFELAGENPQCSTYKISRITDKLLPVITEWRNRPRDLDYPIMRLDATHIKVRVEGKVVSKAIYSILGIDKTGRKDVLGICRKVRAHIFGWRCSMIYMRAVLKTS